MQSFWRRHARKILVGHGTAIALLTTSMMVGTPKAILYFVAPEQEIRVGEALDMTVNLNAKTPINVVGMTLVVPPQVEIVGVSTDDSFIDLWTEDVVINKVGGEIRLSGGTLAKGGVTDIHPVLSFSVRAQEAGEVEFSFKDVEVLAHDGSGETVPTELRAFSRLVVSDPKTTDANGQTDEIARSINFDGENGITLTDFSILLKHLLGPYDTRFDLNQDGLLSLPDLSVFFSMMSNR